MGLVSQGKPWAAPLQLVTAEEEVGLSQRHCRVHYTNVGLVGQTTPELYPHSVLSKTSLESHSNGKL